MLNTMQKPHFSMWSRSWYTFFYEWPVICCKNVKVEKNVRKTYNQKKNAWHGIIERKTLWYLVSYWEGERLGRFGTSNHSYSHELGNEWASKQMKGRSEQGGANERVSSANDRANWRASGPVLTSGFLIVLVHSAMETFPFDICFPTAKKKSQEIYLCLRL